jgi:starch synthase
MSDPALIDKKIAAKTALQQKLEWPIEPRRPIICLPLGMDEDMGGNILKEIMAGILALDCEILIRGRGSKEYGTYLTKIAIDKPHRIAILKDTKESMTTLLMASDMALFLSLSNENVIIKECLHGGVIPIAPESAILKNYNPVQESGNAFTFETQSAWHIFAALVRAIETYKFPFDWRTIQKACVYTTR